MKTAAKIAGALALASGAYAFARLWQAKRTGDRISVSVLNVDKPKISGGALQLSVKVAIDNPTDHTLKLKMPNLKAFYNGNEVGNSIPSATVKDIQGNARTTISGINIQIPYANIGAAALSLITGGSSKIAFDISVSTTVDGIPYTSTKHFEL